MKRNIKAEQIEPVKAARSRQRHENERDVDWIEGYASLPGRLGRGEKARTTEKAEALREQEDLAA